MVELIRKVGFVRASQWLLHGEGFTVDLLVERPFFATWHGDIGEWYVEDGVVRVGANFELIPGLSFCREIDPDIQPICEVALLTLESCSSRAGTWNSNRKMRRTHSHFWIRYQL